MTPDRWPSRQVLAAKYIAPGSSVLDIGCGAMGLRDRLPAGCTYLGIDLPEYDINADRWPDGSWDVGVMLGVFERTTDPAAVLLRLRSMVGRVVLSYTHGGPRGALRDWNDLTQADIQSMAAAAGFDAAIAGTWQYRPIRVQTMWVLS